MAITRTPKNFESPEHQLFDTPIAETFEDNDVRDIKTEEKDDKYEALAKQLANLQSEMAETQRANMALLSQNTGRSQVETFTEVKPESVALPDPALDPDGYDRALAQRQNIRAENQRRQNDIQARRQQEASDKVADLWENFQEKYPNIADDQDRIDFIASSLAKQAQRRGLDLERYMFVTADKFMDDVANKYYEVFGEPEGDNENDLEDAPRQRRSSSRDDTRRPSRRRDRQENEPVGRTSGVFGGNESGGRPGGRGREDDDERGPDMIDDIQQLQLKTGFF
jgi:hypothetical protein